MKMIFSLTITERLPSWNQMLGMQHFQRDKFKSGLALRFLSALRASGNDSSTKIIYAKNTMSIYADTLESFLATKAASRKLKRANARLVKAKTSKPLSKFGRRKA